MKLKDLGWVGSSKKDLLTFPEQVRQEIGYALHMAQRGESYYTTKLFKGHGSGIYEIVSDYNKNAYRAVYFANFHETIYVIHAFQKKSKNGCKTPMEELNVIEDRLKQLKARIEH